ncbi:MAG: phosphopantothenoylcysteine decarboxylase, partial [Bdellovibrionales bacterium]
GRMIEPEDILSAVKDFFFERPLKGLRAVVTSGPTYEPIDPVRFLGNRSSGKQGHAIAQQLIKVGAEVTYITGPTNLPAPNATKTVFVESAQEMLNAVEEALPSQIFIGAAAVCDWGVGSVNAQKLKKEAGNTPSLSLKENPDILKTVANHDRRPELVIGFAAETEDLKNNAENKIKRKNCDWLVGNDVSPAQNIFGSDENQVCLFKYTDDRKSITDQDWPRMTKIQVASKLVEEITHHFENIKGRNNDSANNTIADGTISRVAE